MPILFRCPKCSVLLSSPDQTESTRRRCPQCGQTLQVPSAAINDTGMGQPVKSKGNATRLMEEFCADPNNEPREIFRLVFGNTPVAPLATPPVLELLKRDWRSLRADEFEYFLVEIFAVLGYQAEKTGKAGDRGLDVLVTIGTKRICVQAKGYDGKVDHKAVQETLTDKTY